MSVDPLFPDKYPRGTSTGTVAILCEGDVNSYEADFLEKWAHKALPNGPDVHVWSCGTGHGVRGIADAIGRTIRILALLDRDFHDESSTKNVIKKWETDAEKLGWSFLGVKMWVRNEIENYFLDKDILLPVMTQVFKCSEKDVIQSVDEALKLLVPFQALQAAFHKTRAAWERSDPQATLFQQVDKQLPSYKPKWNESGLSGITAKQLRDDLPERLNKWRSQVHDANGFHEPWKGDDFLSIFDANIKKWSGYKFPTGDWRTEWAGKEILKLVRQQLASKKGGWWSITKKNTDPVAWHNMKRSDQDKHDRMIENELRPLLVNQLVNVITPNGADIRCAEFNELANKLSS